MTRRFYRCYGVVFRAFFDVQSFAEAMRKKATKVTLSLLLSLGARKPPSYFLAFRSILKAKKDHMPPFFWAFLVVWPA